MAQMLKCSRAVKTLGKDMSRRRDLVLAVLARISDLAVPHFVSYLGIWTVDSKATATIRKREDVVERITRWG